MDTLYQFTISNLGKQGISNVRRFTFLLRHLESGLSDDCVELTIGLKGMFYLGIFGKS